MPRLILARGLCPYTTLFRSRGALVEDHHDVRPQLTLHLHWLLGPHEHLGTIHRRGEVHTLLPDLAHGAQAEYLEATGVGEDRSLPLHEVVQVAVLADDLGARAQPQVEGITQNDLRTYILDIPGQHALDRAVGTHGHEGRGFHNTTGKGQAPATGLAVGGEHF